MCRILYEATSKDMIAWPVETSLTDYASAKNERKPGFSPSPYDALSIYPQMLNFPASAATPMVRIFALRGDVNPASAMASTFSSS
jgi:hypothetical protein